MKPHQAMNVRSLKASHKSVHHRTYGTAIRPEEIPTNNFYTFTAFNSGVEKLVIIIEKYVRVNNPSPFFLLQNSHVTKTKLYIFQLLE